MRFLADENIPAAAVAALQAAGHDVVWVRTAIPGASDREVLHRAILEARVLLTFDKDFGELAKMSALPATCGVILFRTPMPQPGDLGNRFVNIIATRDDWAGNFSVVEPGRIRMRRLNAEVPL